ncbi:hypothetical protein FNV43_RR22210 [Rhamnella rubrinervis]|uniref:Leucine-rich repeat-containing N-terminal plant-type domain-containing protein n=1 Tax=Rhamnella rubrinervis TaxID=2594499 RepID=A0A8K0DVR8_9ROSA|nr:hypothetical protein FNV43_RR22210 [Rhamnella rubrinervis]
MVLFPLYFSTYVSSLSLSPSFPLCHSDESYALLQFKNSFSVEYTSVCDGTPPPTTSWEAGSDCCAWSGVMCDNRTGHVIGLDLYCGQLQGIIHSNSSLFLLHHLQSLHLSRNDFRGCAIPHEIGKLSNLQLLEIFGANLSGHIPPQFSYLSKLRTLRLDSLSSKQPLRLTTSTFKRILANLTNLQVLDLSGVDMLYVEPVFLMNLSSSLTSLRIPNCGLQGNSPDTIFHLPKLEQLYLVGNDNLRGSLPRYNWSSSLRKLDLSMTKFLIDIPDLTRNLKYLDSLHLGNCNFVGSYPLLFSNLTQIISLDLSDNNIGGHIPWSSLNLKRMEELNLAGNNFIGQLPRFYSYNGTQISALPYSSENISFGSVPWSINSLDLSNNLLNGTIPNWLYSIPSLTYLNLRNNQFTGHIPEFESFSLQSLDLSNNKLHGSIPSSIFQQVNLGSLDLSSNYLSGFVHNHLSLNNTLAFSSVNTNHSLGILPNLGSLSLSYNQIQGQVPEWLWNVGTDSLLYLNLSHNSLTDIERIPWRNLQYLDLRSNLLHGQLLIPPPSIRVFSVSHNRMTGVVPSWICNLRSLEVLDLANNTLNGKLPPCMGNLSGNLSVLDIRMNKLHGMIPATFFGKKSALRAVNLNGNQLEGFLPPSLLNCEKLEFLDIGNNMINDTFPHWLESLPVLQVLILRSNKFHGSVPNPTVRFPFQKLRILDLSHNKLSGNLPTKLFENLRAMMETDTKKGLEYMGDLYYCQDSVSVEMKGHFYQLVKILTTFTTIDLSSNNFEGEIPQSIGELKSLIVLNISHNKLNGLFPPSLGNLSKLESLDLSSNVLVGTIPQQLSDLNFLSTLDLSENRLVGRIPSGTQFQTFGINSYRGNMDLCGLPLSKLCGNDLQHPSSPNFEQEGDEDEQTNGIDWMIVLIGFGCGMVIGISIGYTVLSEKKIAQLMRRIGGERLCKMLKRLKNKAR